MIEEFKIGDYRLLPKGNKIWSIALQKNVIFEENIIIEVTNTIFGDKTCFFGKMKVLLFNYPGYIPTLINTPNGDVGTININKTLPYKIPEQYTIKYNG